MTLYLNEQEFNELREFGRRAAANEDLRIESKYKIIALDPGLSAEERKQQRKSFCRSVSKMLILSSVASNHQLKAKVRII